MTDKKTAAPVFTEQDTATNISPATILSRDGTQCQGKKFRKPGWGHGNVLSIHSPVYAVAIKCYDEQLAAGEAGDYEGLAGMIRAVDPQKYHVLAIRHDRDIITDGIWDAAAEKPHYHVIVRCADRKSRVKVSTVMNMFGICFRRGTDDALWKEHGVETVGNFAGYAMYLTHETEQAERDGKELYDVSEIVSNLTPEEITQVREGYVRVRENQRVTQDMLASLDREAFDLGHGLKDFDGWYNALPFSVRSNSKIKTIRESYERGADARLAENSEMLRLCIFIQGKPNTGKTYGAEQALSGMKVLKVGGGGTGKFDNLTPSTDVIIIDDDTCPNLLNMSDNYLCRAYRRMSNNPVWAGQYLVVTSNKPFDEWVRGCGIKDEKHISAIRSRFFICHLEDFGGYLPDIAPFPELKLDAYSDRGTDAANNERFGMFEAFEKRFNASLAVYASMQDEDTVGSRFTNHGVGMYMKTFMMMERRDAEQKRKAEEEARLKAEKKAEEAEQSARLADSYRGYKQPGLEKPVIRDPKKCTHYELCPNIGRCPTCDAYEFRYLY